MYQHHKQNELSLESLFEELKRANTIAPPAVTEPATPPSDGPELMVFQKFVHTALGMEAPRQRGGRQAPPSVVFERVTVTDTHARPYLCGYKPDLSIHTSELLPGTFSVMAVVEVQAAEKQSEAPDTEHCGRVMSYNATILECQPQRLHVLSAVTTAQVTHFIRSERAGPDHGSVRHSISSGVEWSKAWPLLAGMAQGRLSLGFQPVVARTAGGLDLMAISVLGRGASGVVYGMCEQTRVADGAGARHEPAYALKVTRVATDAKAEYKFISALRTSLREKNETEVLQHLPTVEMAGDHMLLTPCVTRLRT